MSPTRWALAAACAIAFCFRALVPFYNVFQAGFINFQETDAWFHVRVMEHLVRHFPFRLLVDPYGSILDGSASTPGPSTTGSPPFSPSRGPTNSNPSPPGTPPSSAC